MPTIWFATSATNTCRAVPSCKGKVHSVKTLETITTKVSEISRWGIHDWDAATSLSCSHHGNRTNTQQHLLPGATLTARFVFSPTLWGENYYPIYFIYKITRHRKPGQWAHEAWVHDSNLSTFYTEPASTPVLPNFYDLRTSTQWGLQRNSYWKLKLKRHELAFKIH